MTMMLLALTNVAFAGTSPLGSGGSIGFVFAFLLALASLFLIGGGPGGGHRVRVRVPARYDRRSR